MIILISSSILIGIVSHAYKLIFTLYANENNQNITKIVDVRRVQLLRWRIKQF